jgi:hypothetical protein
VAAAEQTLDVNDLRASEARDEAAFERETDA